MERMQEGEVRHLGVKGSPKAQNIRYKVRVFCCRSRVMFGGLCEGLID